MFCDKLLSFQSPCDSQYKFREKTLISKKSIAVEFTDIGSGIPDINDHAGFAPLSSKPFRPKVMNTTENSFPCGLLTFLILVLVLSAFRSPEHAIYLSLTEIAIEEDTSSLRVKVFSDDLQNALRNFGGSYQHQNLENFFGLNQPLAAQYFQEHLQIRIDGIPVALSLKSHSIENDAHFITFHFPSRDMPEKIQIKADFLMELFPTQTNVIKVQLNQEHKYLKCTKGAERQTLTLTH